MSRERVYRRRVQLVGGGTLAITLPKAWARKFSVKPGSDLLIVVEPSGYLRVYPPAADKGRPTATIEVDSNTDTNTIVRLVIAHYLAGYQYIRLVFPPSVNDKIEKAVEVLKSKVLGIEILEEDNSSVTLCTIVDPEFMDFESVVKRMIRVTLSMLQDLGTALSSGDKALLESVIKRDNLVDKLYLLAMKQLCDKISNPVEILHPLHGVYMSMALKYIERVADHARLLALTLRECGDKVPSSIIGLYDKSMEVFRSATDALSNLDVKRAIDIAKIIDKIREEESRVRGSLRLRKLDTCVEHMLESIRRILAYSIDIVEVIIDLCAVKKYTSEEVNANQRGCKQ